MSLVISAQNYLLMHNLAKMYLRIGNSLTFDPIKHLAGLDPSSPIRHIDEIEPIAPNSMSNLAKDAYYESLSNSLTYMTIVHGPQAKSEVMDEGEDEEYLELEANKDHMFDMTKEIRQKLVKAPLGYSVMVDKLKSYDKLLSVVQTLMDLEEIIMCLLEGLILICITLGVLTGKPYFFILPLTCPLINIACSLINIISAESNAIFSQSLLVIVIEHLRIDFYARRKKFLFKLQLGDCHDFYSAFLDGNENCYEFKRMHLVETAFIYFSSIALFKKDGGSLFDIYLLMVSPFKFVLDKSEVFWTAITRFSITTSSIFSSTLDWFRRKTKYLFMKKVNIKVVWFQACQSGNLAMLKDFIKEESIEDFNARDTKHDNDTGLIMACRNDHLSVVQLLLDNGRSKIDPNLQDGVGESPLIISSKLDHHRIVARLLRCETLHLGEGNGEKAILAAIQEDHYRIAMMIKTCMQKRNIKLKSDNLSTFLARILSLSKDIQKIKNDTAAKAEKLEKLRQYKVLILQSMSNPSSPKETSISQDEVIMEELRSYSDCDICFDSMADRKIFACSNDHWMCQFCKDTSGNECPFCKDDFGKNPPRRCHRVEAVIKLIANL